LRQLHGSFAAIYILQFEIDFRITLGAGFLYKPGEERVFFVFYKYHFQSLEGRLFSQCMLQDKLSFKPKYGYQFSYFNIFCQDNK